MQPDIEGILIKDCTGQELTQSEYLILKDWLSKSDKNQRIHAQMKLVFLYPKDFNMDEIRNDVWSDIQKSAQELSLPTKFQKLFHFGLKTAAVFILVFSLALIIYWMKTGNPLRHETLAEVQLVWKESLPGQKTTTTLPDGTLIKLNADSKILFPENFIGDTREVTLYGEAFFDVAKDEKKPFVIKTKDIQIQVLGTSFNVKAYPGADVSEVSVASGRVAVENAYQKIDLVPGEKVCYQSASRSMVKDRFTWEEAYGWKDNILLFRESGFDEIRERLSRWYGVELLIDGRLPDSTKKYFGSYQDPSLREVLEGLSYVYGFTFEIDKKKIYINFKTNG